MEPISTVVTAAKTLHAIYQVSDFAIKRWSEYRRNQFLEALFENLQIEIASGETRPEVDDALTALLADDESSETLYDAYRRVCFTHSKNYGPRIIGLLTGELISQSKMSSEHEEVVFLAAETLSDVQLIEFKNHYAELLLNFGKDSRCGRNLSGVGETIEESEEFASYQLGSEYGDTVDLLPPNLRESHGAWAALLENCGILSRSAIQKTSPVASVTSENELKDDKHVSLVSVVTYKESALRLYKLLLRTKNETDGNLQIFPIQGLAYKADLSDFFG